MSSDAESPLGASAVPPREPDCRFRTVRRYFEGPMTARCVACRHLVGIEEVGDQFVTMPCGETWALNTRSVLQNRT
jgi:hypothetical protein